MDGTRRLRPTIGTVAWRTLAPAILLAATGWAEPRIVARVDRDSLGWNEQLLLTITVSGVLDSVVPEPHLPALRDFHTSEWLRLAGTGADTTVREQRVVYGRILRPRYPGRLTIGAATLQYRGATYRTPAFKVRVGDSTAARPTPPGETAGGTERRGSDGRTGEVRLRQSVDRDTVYVGEQLTVSCHLGYSTPLAGVTIDSVPEYHGCWVRPIRSLGRASFPPAADGDRQWTVLSRTALFPLEAGTLTLDGIRISGAVVDSGSFLRETLRAFRTSAAPLRAVVLPLPDSGRPSGFSGGVGEFTLESRLDGSASGRDTPLRLCITVAGTGNVELVGRPVVDAPAGLAILAPTDSCRTGLTGTAVTGTRSFGYRLLPQAGGRHVIPGIRMSFFSPARGTYYTLETPPLTFDALDSPHPAAPDEATLSRNGTDIVHIKPDRIALRAPGILSGCRPDPTWCMWMFYPAGILLIAAGLLVRRHRRRTEHEPGYARRRRARPRMLGLVAEARRALSSADMPRFYGLLSRALLGYVGDRFDLRTGTMTLAALGHELADRGISPAVVSDLLAILAECDAGRFSPGGRPERGGPLLERALRTARRL